MLYAYCLKCTVQSTPDKFHCECEEPGCDGEIYALNIQTVGTPLTEPDRITPEELAVKFHNTYERFAPLYGYETKDETKVFDPESPNGKLMIAVCTEMMALMVTDV